MREILSRMISTGSLSAFSASASNGLVSSSGVSATRPSAPIQQVRAQSTTPATQKMDSSTRQPAQVTPGQAMPRGSLLDLSV